MSHPLPDIWLPSGIRITGTREKDAAALEALQYLVFPSLSEEEIIHAPQYKKHLEIFPEGQMIALDGDLLVAGATCMRYDFDREQPAHHTFADIMAGGWLTTHQPHGEWLYGMDISVHPDYRQRGIARGFYRMRQLLARALGLKGQVTVGMLNGYAAYQSLLTIDAYYEKVKKGEIFDPTLSVQQKIGFEIQALIKSYLNDPTCGNAGALIVLDVNRDV